MIESKSTTGKKIERILRYGMAKRRCAGSCPFDLVTEHAGPGERAHARPAACHTCASARRGILLLPMARVRRERGGVQAGGRWRPQRNPSAAWNDSTAGPAGPAGGAAVARRLGSGIRPSSYSPVELWPATEGRRRAPTAAPAGRQRTARSPREYEHRQGARVRPQRRHPKEHARTIPGHRQRPHTLRREARHRRLPAPCPGANAMAGARNTNRARRFERPTKGGAMRIRIALATASVAAFTVLCITLPAGAPRAGALSADATHHAGERTGGARHLGAQAGTADWASSSSPSPRRRRASWRRRHLRLHRRHQYRHRRLACIRMRESGTATTARPRRRCLRHRGRTWESYATAVALRGTRRIPGRVGPSALQRVRLGPWSSRFACGL